MKKKTVSSSKQSLTIAVVVAAILIPIGLFVSCMAQKQEDEFTKTPLSELRAMHPTKLTKLGAAPQQGDKLRRPPSGAQYVKYNSNVGILGGWIVSPETTGKVPAILWAHSGFAVSAGDVTQVWPFVKAGYLVMIPAWRAENGNIGNFEMCYGEINDAVAAVAYLRSLPNVDPDRIYAAGHSSGGTSVLLLSQLCKDLKKVAACGAFPNMRKRQPYEGAPFNKKDVYELTCRSPGDHIKDISCPLLLLYGADEADYVKQAEEMKKVGSRLGKKIEVGEIAGTDHYTAVEPAVTKMISFFDE